MPSKLMFPSSASVIYVVSPAVVVGANSVYVVTSYLLKAVVPIALSAAESSYTGALSGPSPNTLTVAVIFAAQSLLGHNGVFFK